MMEISFKSTGEQLKIDTFWLRDHCRCAACYNVATKQRKYNLIDLPANVSPLTSSYSQDGLSYNVKWSDGHESNYTLQFIYDAQLEQRLQCKTSLASCQVAWNREFVLQNEPQLRVTLSQLVRSEEAVRQVVQSLVRSGIAFVEEVPADPTMTEMAVRRLFPVMRTFFGEMWTFSDQVADHADTAYTQEFLGSHTDNTYFCDAAGLQVLHCIEHTNGTGGENFFVDGLHAAHELRRRNECAYELLTRVPLPAEYIEDGQHHKYATPLIRTDPLTGDVVQLCLNVYDRAAFDTLPQTQMAEYYACLREYLRIVQNADNQWKFKLNPGTMVLFDNWRVYHGRCAYTGFRKVSGCYVQRTDFLSKARVLGLID